jgi:aspartate/methionine/tyrosine aminotransferase
MGLNVPVMPDGAFYAWADCTEACAKLGIEGSWDFAFEVMRRAHVAITPGRDFGNHDMHRYVRFSTASSMAQLQEAAARLKAHDRHAADAVFQWPVRSTGKTPTPAASCSTPTT